MNILLIIFLIILLPILIFLFGTVAILAGVFLTYLIPFLLGLVFLCIVFS